jgi:hypothetical protein
MRASLFSKGLSRTICLALTAVLAAGPGSGLAIAAASADRATSALSVTTDPVGAEVYVDGALAGRTPLTLDAVSVGDHRVRVVKDGFLENSRIVGVRGNGPNAIAIKLTRDVTGSAPARSRALAPGDGSKKWLWIGLGAAAVVGGALLLMPKNDAPTIGGVTASTSTGFAAVTSITFTANASDKDGDSLTYNWDFGSGVTSTSQSPSATFNAAGTYTVRVTVSDGKKSATATTTVTIRSMTGTWRGSLFNSTMVFTQNGTALTGTYTDVDGAGTITGGVISATAPNIRFTVTQPQISFQALFTGNPDAAGNVISGTFGGLAMTLTRQ